MPDNLLKRISDLLYLRTGLLLLFLSCSIIYAQKYNLKRYNINGTYSYLCTIDHYYYFKNYNFNIIKVNKDVNEKAEEFKLKTDDSDNLIQVINNSNNFIGFAVLTRKYLPEYLKGKTSDNPKYEYVRYKINFYKFDQNGHKTSKESFDIGLQDTNTLTYAINFDKKLIRIYQKDSNIQTYDFDLKKIADIENIKAENIMESSTYNVLDNLLAFLQSANLDIKKLLGDDFQFVKETKTDTVNFADFSVSYKQVEEKTRFFNNYISDLIVYSKDGDKFLKETDINPGMDKMILSAEFKILQNSNILVYGKYKENGKGSNPMYGLFSCILNKNLDFVKDLNYLELARLDDYSKTIGNDKYNGLILKNLSEQDYSYHIDQSEETDEAFVYTYRYAFNNLYDHIYILKISSSGEILVNLIGNRIKRSKGFYLIKDYSAILIGNKLKFFFYDNIENKTSKINSINVALTEPKKKTTAMVSCTYDLSNDDFSDKEIISDMKSIGKVVPKLNGKQYYIDESSNLYTIFFSGLNKKGNEVEIVSLIFSE